jgi:hypothetical protein
MKFSTFVYELLIVAAAGIAIYFIVKAIEAVFEARRKMRSDLIAWLTDHEYNLTHFPGDDATWSVSYFPAPDDVAIPVVIGRAKKWDDAIREAQDARIRHSIALAPEPDRQLKPGERITVNEKAPQWAWGKVLIVDSVESWGVQCYTEESARRASTFSRFPDQLTDAPDMVRLAVDWDQIAPATFEGRIL